MPKMPYQIVDGLENIRKILGYRLENWSFYINFFALIRKWDNDYYLIHSNSS